MMRWLRGWAQIRLSGAATELALNRFSAAGIAFWNIVQEDGLHLRCRIYQTDLARAEKAALRAMCTLESLHQHGFPLWWEKLKRRPVLTFGVPLAVALALFAQQFIWVVRIEGNRQISSEAIRHALWEQGVHFGVWGQAIDSPHLRMRMQLALPELQWLAANRSGSVLTVLVAERDTQSRKTPQTQPANVVASRAGIVTSVSALNGSAAVEEGDAVLTGQLLISGVTSWENRTQITRASGEVYALTDRQICVSTPESCAGKRYTGRRAWACYLFFGRNRRKIFGNSRISTGSCDKMIHREVCTLPNGDALPFGWETVEYRFYTPQAVAVDALTAESLLRAFAQRSAEADMIAGSVLQSSLELAKDQGCYRLTGDLSCEEMISRTVPIGSLGEDEEIGEADQRGTD